MLPKFSEYNSDKPGDVMYKISSLKIIFIEEVRKLFYNIVNMTFYLDNIYLMCVFI